MAIAVSVAVAPDAVGGVHPMLVLWSDGRISAYNGAQVPQKSSGQDNDAAPGWNFPRYYAYGTNGPTPTAGVAAGEIAKKIVVIASSWATLADIKGHVLDGWGRVTPFGSTTLKLTETGYWGPPAGLGVGQDVARSMRINPADATRGYVMDNAGAMHRFGNQATTPNGAPVPYPLYDYAVDFDIDWTPATGAHGIILGASGELTYFAHPNDPVLFQTIWGGHYYGGYPIMRSIEVNFTGSLAAVGYAMDGFGTPWELGIGDPLVGEPGQGEQLLGGPYSKADIYQELDWPKKSTLFFVSLSDNGTPTPWQKFVKPTVTFIAPGNTSRPGLKFTYGPSSGTPAVAALSQVTAFLYPFSVTQTGDFRPRQGDGAIWSYKDSGITGIEGGGVYDAGPASEFVINDVVVDELPNGYHYVLYVQAVSVEGVKSGWVADDRTTSYTGITAPGLAVVPLPDDPLGRRVRLTASGLGGGQTYEYQFSDDNVTFEDVIGGVTATTPIYDTTALPLKQRWYRVYKVTASPYLRSNPSSTQTVTMAMPAIGTTWRIVKLSDGSFIDLHSAEWEGTGRQPHTVTDPAGDSFGSLNSAGYRGLDATLQCQTKTMAEYTALLALLKKPQNVLLQAPYDQWYGWIKEWTFEMEHAGPRAAPHPDSVYSVGIVHKWRLPFLETFFGGVA